MTKISTPEHAETNAEAAVEREVPAPVSQSMTPPAHVISNILNFSKALEVNTSGSGNVFAVVKN
jgi:hypothetical protein